MIRHLFTLIWNRKRANFLLITEMFFAFIVLFVVSSLLVYNRQLYQAPLGFDYEQVWTVDLDNGSTTQTIAEIVSTEQQILRRLQSLPGVRYAALSSSNTPFSGNHNSTDLSLTPKGEGPNSDIYMVSEEIRNVLRLPLKAGRWFDKRDEATTHKPVVISEETQARLFPGQSAVGKIMYSGDREWQIVGVTGPMRGNGDLSESRPAFFAYANPQDTTLSHLSRLLVRVEPDAGAELEKRMSTEIMAIGKGWTSGITPMAEQRATQLEAGLAPLVALVIVCVFLIVNVALGLFGVLWQTISQRRAEIGVRRAMGATAGAVSGQIVGEIMVVATFGLVLGLLVAAQFPLLGVFGVKTSVYLMAMLLATVLIYVLTALCAFYPSRLAAGIHPAVALREE
jgi:putative ABC transport system permease protein